MTNGVRPKRTHEEQVEYLLAKIAELMAEKDRIRGAAARLMVEDHLDWQQILEGELAQLLGVQPGREPFTWHWHDHVTEGLGVDEECLWPDPERTDADG